MRGSPFLALVLLGALAACSGRSGSPVCGLAVLAGPTVIYQQLADPRMILTEAPRGLPTSLPALVGGQATQGAVAVAYDTSRHLSLSYQGPSFPAPGAGYALLVVDDTSSRVEGVLIYDSNDPRAIRLGFRRFAPLRLALLLSSTRTRAGTKTISPPISQLVSKPGSPSSNSRCHREKIRRLAG